MANAINPGDHDERTRRSPILRRMRPATLPDAGRAAHVALRDAEWIRNVIGKRLCELRGGEEHGVRARALPVKTPRACWPAIC